MDDARDGVIERVYVMSIANGVTIPRNEINRVYMMSFYFYLMGLEKVGKKS